MNRAVLRRSGLHGSILFAAAILCACNSRDSSRLQGYVEGEFVYVSAPVSGTLRNLQVSRGTAVASNAALFEIEATPLLAQRDAARARLSQAQATSQDAVKGMRPSELASVQAQYNQAIAAQKLAAAELIRQQKIFATVGATSQQDVDRARMARDQADDQVSGLAAQLTTAKLGARNDQVTAARANADALQAQLTQAEWELSQSKQAAPVAATVTDTLYRQGEWVAAGKPIVVLLPPDNVKVRTYVAEADLTRLKVGDAANIYLDGKTEPVSGTIRFIAPTLEYTPPVVYSQSMRNKMVALVEIGVDAATNLHPGQPVEVQFVHVQ